MAQVPSTRRRISSPADRSLGLGVDALDQYLERIGRHNLLTPSEEVELAQAIETGNEARAGIGCWIDYLQLPAASFGAPWTHAAGSL